MLEAKQMNTKIKHLYLDDFTEDLYELSQQNIK